MSRPGPDTEAENLKPCHGIDASTVEALRGVLTRFGVTFCPSALTGVSPPSEAKINAEKTAVDDTLALWTKRLTCWLAQASNPTLLGVDVCVELCLELLCRMVAAHGGLWKVQSDRNFVYKAAEKFLSERLHKWDGFFPSTTKAESTEAVRDFACLVWRTAKGVVQQSKEKSKAKPKSPLKQTELKTVPKEVVKDVADFEEVHVEEEGEELEEDEEFRKGVEAAKKALRGAGEQDSDLVGGEFPTHVASRTRSSKATEKGLPAVYGLAPPKSNAPPRPSPPPKQPKEKKRSASPSKIVLRNVSKKV